jgi:hypothetical protein
VNDETITITLELRVAADSLTGHCVGPEGAARRFAGWLGLMAAIDALLADREPRSRVEAEQGRER